jgi:hypothetical protein
MARSKVVKFARKPSYLEREAAPAHYIPAPRPVDRGTGIRGAVGCLMAVKWQ